MNNQYNVLIDIVGALLVCAIIIAERSQKRSGDPLNAKLLHRLMFCCTLVFATDIVGLLLDGCTLAGARVILWFADSAYWMLQIVYCWMWLMFADYWSFGSSEHLKKFRTFYAAPMLAELLLIIINPFTGWIFTLDSLNIYVRGALYLPNLLVYGLYIAAAFVMTFCGCRASRDPAQRRRKISLVVYMLLPACGVLFDAFVYGISWVWPMVALSLLMVYLNIQQQEISEERLAAAELKQELTESRVAIMLSQIQPHFLYNALNTVDALCDVDTKAAQEAIRCFAKYLRGNLDALSRETPVPFRDELSHLRQYLTLETFRFDNIQVDYDLEAMDFMLPPLTLQPIVENAVKYGVLKRREGGTITISTRDKGSFIQLVVQDDGMGFDSTAKPADGRSHIGIENVRRRLETMCGGTLSVDSVPNVGTIVTFSIPKGGQKNESDRGGRRKACG